MIYLQSNFIFLFSSTDITEIDTIQRLPIEKNRKVFFTTVKKYWYSTYKFSYSTMFQKETDFILYLNGYEVRGYLGMKATTSSNFHFKYVFFLFYPGEHIVAIVSWPLSHVRKNFLFHMLFLPVLGFLKIITGIVNT